MKKSRLELKMRLIDEIFTKSTRGAKVRKDILEEIKDGRISGETFRFANKNYGMF